MERLFLRRHLRIGIPPGAQLQPAANPAEAFCRIRSAFAGAYRAHYCLGQTIRLNRPLGFLQQSLGNNQRFRLGCWRALAFHILTISGEPDCLLES